MCPRGLFLVLEAIQAACPSFRTQVLVLVLGFQDLGLVRDLKINSLAIIPRFLINFFINHY